ncbi:MAG: pilus assembly protein TadG-related protein, partial [Bryobacteraceae bacterium]
LVGMLGLTTDLGRAFVIRNELQTFADAASIAAAYELNGTRTGLLSANAIAGTGPKSASAANRWDFGTQPVTSVDIGFSDNLEGEYRALRDANPESRFVRVSASVTASLFFLPIVPGIGKAMPLRATAIAGQGEVDTPGDALAPFAVNAPDTAAAEGGLVRGKMYDLQYIDLGQGQESQSVFNGVVNNDYSAHGPAILRAGDPVALVNASPEWNAAVAGGIAQRIAQDNDPGTGVFENYFGNGRRILFVPVTGPAAKPLVVGFASFFLPPSTCATAGKPCSGTYVGSGVIGGPGTAAASGAAYAVKLFR